MEVIIFLIYDLTLEGLLLQSWFQAPFVLKHLVACRTVAGNPLTVMNVELHKANIPMEM